MLKESILCPTKGLIEQIIKILRGDSKKVGPRTIFRDTLNKLEKWNKNTPLCRPCQRFLLEEKYFKVEKSLFKKIINEIEGNKIS
jgi:hypothetical protein